MAMESILGLLRHLLTFGGGFLVAKGLVDETTMAELVGAGITVIGGVWSIYNKAQAAKKAG